MADISTELARILSAIYGEDVRGSIHDAIEKINDVAEVVLTTGTDVTSPSSSSTGYYEDSLYLNTDTFELWKCTGVNTWASQGTLKGEAGDDGNGIVSITKTSTSGLVDTYTITYTDGNTSTFNVTNGADGANGNKWYRGTGISGKAALPTVYTTSGVADANSGDMFLNPSEGAIYHCVTGGDDTTATWSYDFTMTGGGGGGSIVTWTQIQLSGTKIAEVDIDGSMQEVYAPEGGGGGMLPYLYIDSEAGATVTVNQPDGTVITPTAAGSGHWECELTGGYGTYVIHSVLSGQGDATQSLAVDTVKEYHITDTHYDYTINVTAPSGSSIRITGSSETYTGTGTGSSQAFAVHTPSTTYTVAVTMDGNTKSETITSAATSGRSGSVTIAFGTINLTYANDFRGKTITCTKNGITVTKTAPSSGNTMTFRVPTTGTWTISGTVSGTAYSVEANVTSLSTAVSVNLQTTINVNVTLHGAVGAVITYTDANGSQTQTLDSTGKKTNVSISVMPSSPTIVFTDTTVAKDPDNLSNNYTKSVTITDSTTNIYVMPDNALYWYGYISSDCEQRTAANGWAMSGYTAGTPKYNTNYIDCNSGSNQIIGIGKKTAVSSASTLKIIYEGKKAAGSAGSNSQIEVHVDKSSWTAEQAIELKSMVMAFHSTSVNADRYVAFDVFPTRQAYLYAMWLDN